MISAMKTEGTKQELHVASTSGGMSHPLGQLLQGRALFCPLLYLQCPKQCLHRGTPQVLNKESCMNEKTLLIFSHSFVLTLASPPPPTLRSPNV